MKKYIFHMVRKNAIVPKWKSYCSVSVYGIVAEFKRSSYSHAISSSLLSITTSHTVHKYKLQNAHF